MKRLAAERLERLEDALRHLREAAAGNAVIVEGKRDAAALTELGVGGQHIIFYGAQPVEVFVDRLAEDAELHDWSKVILLTDWDRTGGRLFRRFWDGLQGRAPVDGDLRRRLASACQCKCVEHVPAELAALRRSSTPA